MIIMNGRLTIDEGFMTYIFGLSFINHDWVDFYPRTGNLLTNVDLQLVKCEYSPGFIKELTNTVTYKKQHENKINTK